MNLQEFYQKRAKHYLGTAIGASASIVCLVGIRSDVGSFLGYSGLMLSTGYGVAVATANQKMTQWHPQFERSIRQDEAQKWESKVVRLESEWQRKVSVTQTELQSLKNALQQAKDAIQEYVGVTQKNEALQTQLTAITQKLEHFQNNYEIELETAIEENWQGYLEKIKTRNSEHRVRERELLGAFKDIEQKYQSSLALLVNQYTELIAGYESVIDSFHPELETIKAEFSARMQSVSEERDRVYAILGQYQKPGKFDGSGHAAAVGNQVLEFYLSRDLIADPVKCDYRATGHVDVWVKPRTGTVDKYESLARELWISLNLQDSPKFRIDDGAIRVTLHIDPSEGKRTIKDVEEPSPDWFLHAVADCQHIRVTGERDSGKSTLVSNIVDLKLVQNPGCKIKLCNPLYGSKKDRWNIPATWKSFDEAIDGLAEASALILERNRIGRKAKDAGLPTPDFEPILYIFDEIDTTVSVHGKEATELLKNCLTKGTHYDVHIIYLGQSPLCSTLKLNRPDFNHSTNFHLGQNIGRAIDDNPTLTEKVKNHLKHQYELRRAKNDNYVLFCDYGKNHFLALPPAPNCYKLEAPQVTDQVQGDEIRTQLERLLDNSSGDFGANPTPPQTPENTGKFNLGVSGDKAPKCPQCGSFNLHKKGKRGDKQRYLCKDCGKNFTRG